jgi:hypothetical protein
VGDDPSPRRVVGRSSARAFRLARVLWIALAIVIWNLVFDRMIISAGRQYVRAAVAAADGSGAYLRADDWMRAARQRALWTAGAASGGVLVIGLGLIAIASRKSQAMNHKA